MKVFRMFRHLNIEVLQLSQETLLCLHYPGDTRGVSRAGYPFGSPGGIGKITYIRASHPESALRGGTRNPPGAHQSPNSNSNGTFSSNLTRHSEARASARRPRNPPTIHPATPPPGPTSGILAHALVARHPPAEHAYVVPKVGLHEALFVRKVHDLLLLVVFDHRTRCEAEEE